MITYDVLLQFLAASRFAMAVSLLLLVVSTIYSYRKIEKNRRRKRLFLLSRLYLFPGVLLLGRYVYLILTNKIYSVNTVEEIVYINVLMSFIVASFTATTYARSKDAKLMELESRKSLFRKHHHDVTKS